VLSSFILFSPKVFRVVGPITHARRSFRRGDSTGTALVELLPDAEAIGLLALMLFQDSRRQARTSVAGDIILLEDQDRSLGTTDKSPKPRQ